MSTRTILPGRQNRDLSGPPTAPGASCERIRAAAPAVNHRPLNEPSDLPRSTSRRSRRQCPSSGVRMIRSPCPRQLIRIFIPHSRRIDSFIRHQRLAHDPTGTMEGSPGVRCYHGHMTGPIAIARLSTKVARGVTGITSDVANLEGRRRSAIRAAGSSGPSMSREASTRSPDERRRVRIHHDHALHDS